jgi:hypothetical protein
MLRNPHGIAPVYFGITNTVKDGSYAGVTHIALH